MSDLRDPSHALIPSTLRTRLEKAARDNGFDLDLVTDGGWLGFASSHAPLRVWVGVEPALASSNPPLAADRSSFYVALSQPGVLRALDDPGYAPSSPVPSGACGARGVPDIPSLHRLLRRAWQLSRTLPDELLHAFEKRTAALPRTTEAERLVVQRVGQDLFREGLLDYWDRRCAITGLAVPELLRASHIKPWADCQTDAERLDVFNGFLLAPHLDAAFDAGFFTVDDDGGVVVAEGLRREDRVVLGLAVPLRVRGLAEGHRRYLGWHQERVFRGDEG